MCYRQCMYRLSQDDSVVGAWALRGGWGLLVAVPATQTERDVAGGVFGGVSLAFRGVRRRRRVEPGLSGRLSLGREAGQCVGRRTSRRASAVGGLASVRLRLVAEVAAHCDDEDGGVGEAGEVAGIRPMRTRERSSSKASRGTTAQVRCSRRPWALSRVLRDGAESKRRMRMSSSSAVWLRLAGMA